MDYVKIFAELLVASVVNDPTTQ